MYSVKDENEYFVLNPTAKDVQALEEKLVMKFITEKSKNFLVIFVVASHGVNLDGQQAVVLNEFDGIREYYQFWEIEDTICAYAILQNVYCMAFLGCCREIYNPDRAPRGFKSQIEAE